MERHELGAVHRVERRRRFAGARVGMLAEQRPPEFAVGDKLRRRLLLLNRLQVLLLQDRELVLGNGRVHRHVGDELQQPRCELRKPAHQTDV